MRPVIWYWRKVAIYKSKILAYRYSFRGDIMCQTLTKKFKLDGREPGWLISLAKDATQINRWEI